MTDLNELQENWGLLPHQANFLYAFLKIYNPRGKDVLELGGAMPKDLVIDCLGANSWTCLQSNEYTKYRDDNQKPSTFVGTSAYRTIYAEAEEFLVDLGFRYDAIFSIAAFEHFLRLPTVARLLPNIIADDGILFSIFAPIWSGPYGQHFTHNVPTRFYSKGTSTNWTTQDIFDAPWDHLALSPSQYLKKYAEKFDNEFAELITYETFHSPQINRLFYEDFLLIFDNYFERLEVRALFPIDVNGNQKYAQQHTIVQKLYSNKGYSNFLYSGIYLLLKRQFSPPSSHRL